MKEPFAVGRMAHRKAVISAFDRPCKIQWSFANAVVKLAALDDIPIYVETTSDPDHFQLVHLRYGIDLPPECFDILAGYVRAVANSRGFKSRPDRNGFFAVRPSEARL